MTTDGHVRFLAKLYSRFDRLTESGARELVSILESASDDTLLLLVDHKVRWCWSIARRILRERAGRTAKVEV